MRFTYFESKPTSQKHQFVNPSRAIHLLSNPTQHPRNLKLATLSCDSLTFESKKPQFVNPSRAIHLLLNPDQRHRHVKLLTPLEQFIYFWIQINTTEASIADRLSKTYDYSWDVCKMTTWKRVKYHMSFSKTIARVGNIFFMHCATTRTACWLTISFRWQ